MSQSISTLVNRLPNRGITVYVLEALDFVVPGEWDNVTDFEALVKEVTGETDPELIKSVIKRSDELYDDSNEGYQRAMMLYRTTDRMDKALGAAAFVDTVGQRIGFLSFLSRLTPKADTAQSIDFGLKLVVELLGFCLINGIPGDSVDDFVKSLSNYSKESVMRMAALVSLDGLIPLGPDFSRNVVQLMEKLSPEELEKNDTFQKIKEFIPGGDSTAKLAFVQKSLNAVKSWIDNFTANRNLTPQNITDSLEKYIDIADSQLDYFGAFLDMTTNYYRHTGTQTIARRIIERAINEI